jgi:signal transduction histidine kinase
VTIRVRKVRDTIIVTVSDNGGGVPESEISKLFTPYYSTKEMGTGIGLYMSKMIIEKNMKGKMSVKNLNDGLEVRIDFGKRSG